MDALVYRTASPGYPTRYQRSRTAIDTETLLRLAHERGLPDSAVRSALCRYRSV